MVELNNLLPSYPPTLPIFFVPCVFLCIFYPIHFHLTTKKNRGVLDHTATMEPELQNEQSFRPMSKRSFLHSGHQPHFPRKPFSLGLHYSSFRGTTRHMQNSLTQACSTNICLTSFSYVSATLKPIKMGNIAPPVLKGPFVISWQLREKIKLFFPCMKPRHRRRFPFPPSIGIFRGFLCGLRRRDKVFLFRGQKMKRDRRQM